MTQTAVGTEIITVNETLYPVAEFGCTPEAVLSAELAGKLVIAQQVFDETGAPFHMAEPGKWRDDLPAAEWDLYIAHLKAQRESGAPLPTVPMLPYLGKVRTLGEDAAYFALQPEESLHTAILPFGVVRAHDGMASRFRLFKVV